MVMAANNENGVVQPWREIADLCRERRTEYLCDACQWLGKGESLHLGKAGWFFGSAHKFGGPKGSGFLAMPDNTSGFQGMLGGAHQGGARAGTEDFPNASALVAALGHPMPPEAPRLAWRDQFIRTIKDKIPGTSVVGEPSPRLWNTVALLLPHGENHRWVLKLDRLGFQLSTGSACATVKEGPSHVLTALGLSASESRRLVRVSSGWETSADDWQSLAEAFSSVDKDLRLSNDIVLPP